MGYRRLDQVIHWAGRHHQRLKWLHSLWALLLGIGVIFFFRHDFGFIRLIIAYLFFIWTASLLLHWEAARWSITEERRPKIRRVVLYIIQNFYHEMLFFILPLYYTSTTFSSPNALFLVLIVGCALLASFDSVYWHWLTGNTWWPRVFYCFLLFACFNIFFPVIVGIRNSYGLYLAGGASALAMITLSRHPREWWSLAAGKHFASALAVILLCLYIFRGLIPPCPLVLHEVTFSTAFQPKGLRSIHEIRGAEELAEAKFLYVLAAVKAPLGIYEKVVIEWYRNGRSVRQGRLVTMTGGREEGFRIWDGIRLSEKPVAEYRVDVESEGGQLIGRGYLPVR